MTQLMEKFEKARESSPELRDADVVVFVHPSVWARVAPLEREALRAAGFEVHAPPTHELQMLAAMMGMEVDRRFWDPDNVYFVRKDQLRMAL